MGYPDLGTWNEKRPNEAEADAVAVAEQLAWSTIDTLTAGRVAFTTTLVRPTTVENDGTVLLPGPVGGVQVVRIDGFVFTRWQIDGTRLYRLDGEAWPVNSDMSLAAGDEGTFEVTYFRGWQPGRLLIWAAGELASEFYKASSGGRNCRLPKNVTAVTRQGVSFEMTTPLFDNGKTGILEIDLVLQRYNPLHARTTSSVSSVDSIARQARRY